MIDGEELNIKKYLNDKEVGKSKTVMVEDSPEIKDSILQDSIVS